MTSIPITFTEAQVNTLISAMIDKKIDNDRYLTGREAGDQPTAYESCCAHHLAQYHRDKSMRDTLLAQREHYLGVIALLKQALASGDPAASATAAPPFGICLDAASLRAEIAEAPESHDLDPEQAAAICDMDDHIIGQAIDASLTDDFYDQYDSVRRDAIAGLRNDLENLSDAD